MKIKLPLDVPALQLKADRLFSTWIRNKKSIDGICRCITCDKHYPVKQIDAGHFIEREHMATRYEENNVWPQCQHCNRFKGGRKSVYRDKLIGLVGIVEVERLEKLKYQIVPFKRLLLDEVISNHRIKKEEK